MPIKYCCCLLLSLSLIACHPRNKTISFYYWRTQFSLDSLESKTLRDNAVHTLYIRYFDVDWAPADTAPAPIAPIRFDHPVQDYTIVPVIYFRNRVFEKLAPPAIPSFAQKVFSLVSGINNTQRFRPDETQFDCDWTERTKDNYFSFLRQYRLLSGQTISSTIRLHQVKYPERTGIPPVDHGVLMFYNMGNIDAGKGSSIYDKAIAHRYTPSLRSYPLALDVALPVFSWGLQIREGRVISLLDKMNAGLFEKDTNFIRLNVNRYSAAHACFKSGYYFQEKDAVKIESVPADELLNIVSEVNRHSNHGIRNLIFYDLDKDNIAQYDKNIFKEILDHTD